jgi:hypothetical protein
MLQGLCLVLHHTEWFIEPSTIELPIAASEHSIGP